MTISRQQTTPAITQSHCPHNVTTISLPRIPPSSNQYFHFFIYAFSFLLLCFVLLIFIIKLFIFVWQDRIQYRRAKKQGTSVQALETATNTERWKLQVRPDNHLFFKKKVGTIIFNEPSTILELALLCPAQPANSQLRRLYIEFYYYATATRKSGISGTSDETYANRRLKGSSEGTQKKK